MSDILKYSKALMHHWAQLATGGFTMAVVWLLREVFGFHIWEWTNAVLALIFLQVASYLVWKEDRAKAKTPLQIRDEADALIKAGREILQRFKAVETIPSNDIMRRWSEDVHRFSRRHLNTIQADLLKPKHRFTDDEVIAHNCVSLDTPEEEYRRIAPFLGKVKALEDVSETIEG